MTLKTSSRKINPFWNMVWFTVRKNLGIIIVLCIVALLVCPGIYIVNFEELYANRYTVEHTYGNTPQDFSNAFGIAISVAAPVFAAIFSFVNFSFLYKKSASDVFHSFPLTRTELLLSRMLGGIISSFVPILLCTLFYAGMVIFNPWLGNFGVLLYYLALTINFTLLWTSFITVFVVCAGSAFDLVLSFFGLNIAVIVTGFIANSIFSEKLTGYDSDVMPILYKISLPFFCATHYSVAFWIKSVIYTAVFTLAALLLYNKRKAEKGGTAYAYKFMYYACSVLISICGGFLVGILFSNDIEYNTVFWIFSLIGAIVSALIYGLITNRGLKGASRSLITGGIAWGLLFAIMLTSITGGFGFTNRIPNAKNIKSVTVTANDERITFSNPSIVLTLHEKAISGAKEYKKQSNNENLLSDSHAEIVSDVYFDYTLKNGVTVQRRFRLPFSTINDELLTVLKSEERYNAIIENSFVNSSSIKQIEYNFFGKDYYQETTGYIQVAEYKEFIETYWKELQKIEHYSQAHDYTGDYYLHFTVECDDDVHYFTLELSDTFYETIKCVENFKY